VQKEKEKETKEKEEVSKNGKTEEEKRESLHFDQRIEGSAAMEMKQLRACVLSPISIFKKRRF
jgi:hypothetical protein